ncbi:hypothetical protein FAI40_01615 [Acetobacteraceae bacterium]|nr:hypothetical protein FAI40_01615 [Acetobacteraceae bacterium]
MKNSITPEMLEEKRKSAGFKSRASAAKNMGIGLRTYQRWLSNEQEIPTLPYKYLSLLSEINQIKEKYL